MPPKGRRKSSTKGLKKGASKEELAAAAEAAKKMAHVVERLKSGSTAEKVKAARSFCSVRGKIAGLYAIAVNPWPTVEPAMAPLVALLVSDAEVSPSDSVLQQEAAADALHDLVTKSLTLFIPGFHECNPVIDAIVGAGGIAQLVNLTRSGPAIEQAVDLLCHLATTTAHRTSIVYSRAIGPLLQLIQDGSDSQRLRSAMALGSLAFSHGAAQSAIKLAGGDKILTQLAETGTTSQQEMAEYALKSLQSADPNAAPSSHEPALRAPASAKAESKDTPPADISDPPWPFIDDNGVCGVPSRA
tara:strand:- start:230 stop:1132 length:903 start_codon:yes stop_codon:yes gene_type:complete